MPLRLTSRQWRAILAWFVRGVTSAQIAHETGLDRKRVLRALTVVRHAIAGRPRPNPRAAARARVQPSPVVGLQVAQGEARAEVVAEADAEAFRRAVSSRTDPRAIAGPALRRFAAVVYRGRFYRLRPSGTDRAAARFGDVEGFWAYLRHRLTGKGGIRRERVGLYLAEYAWRYNHRRVTSDEQVRELLGLLHEAPRWNERDFAAAETMSRRHDRRVPDRSAEPQN